MSRKKAQAGGGESNKKMEAKRKKTTLKRERMRVKSHATDIENKKQ